MPQVEEQIKQLTDKHATGDEFISSQAGVEDVEGPFLILVHVCWLLTPTGLL